MAKKRANGEGNIRKRKDGRWEGRYTAGHDLETGKPIYKNVLGRTQAETTTKLKVEKWFQTAGKPWHGRVAPRHVFCPVWVMVWGNCKFCKIALFLRKPLDAKAEKPSDFYEIRRFCDCGA